MPRAEVCGRALVDAEKKGETKNERQGGKKRKGVIKCRLKEEWDEADFAGKRFVFGFSDWLSRR